MLSANFDPVQRANPFPPKAKQSSESTKERLLKAALPVMQMIAVTRPIATLVNGAYTVIPLGQEIIRSFNEEDKKALSSALLHGAFLTATITSTILLPIPTMIATFTYQLGSEAKSLIQNLQEKKYDAAAGHFFNIVNQTSYMGAMMLGGPQLLILALVLQAGKELYQAREEFAQGRYIETSFNILLASLRLYAAHSHYVNIPSKPTKAPESIIQIPEEPQEPQGPKNVSQGDVDLMFGQAATKAAENPGEYVSFSNLLAENGFTNDIENVNIST